MGRSLRYELTKGIVLNLVPMGYGKPDAHSCCTLWHRPLIEAQVWPLSRALIIQSCQSSDQISALRRIYLGAP